MQTSAISLETIQKIREEINEVPERYEHNIKLLEDWMNSVEFLPKNYDKNLLSVFLRGSKHDLEKAKQKIIKFFVMKNKAHAFFSYHEFNQEELLKLKTSYFTFMPELTPDGYQLVMGGIIHGDIELYDPVILYKYIYMLMHYQAINGTMNAGYATYIDCTHFSLAHCLKVVSSPDFKRSLIMLNEIMPVRVKSIIFFNTPSFIHKFTTILKMILNEKLRKRIRIYPDDAIIREEIPLQCLPRDYGGAQKSLRELAIDQENYVLKKAKNWYAVQEQVQVNGKVPEDFDKFNCGFIDESDVFGQQGSFRQMQFD